MASERNYREEARNLARAEEAQLRTLLLAFDVIDNAVKAASSILDPLRRGKAQEEDGRVS